MSGAPLEAWALLAVVWLACAAGSGWVLALIARRAHPSLSLPRLWIFYSVLMSVLVAVVFAIGWW